MFKIKYLSLKGYYKILRKRKIVIDFIISKYVKGYNRLYN